MQGQTLQQQVEYWRHKLSHTDVDGTRKLVNAIDLETDYERPQVASTRGGVKMQKLMLTEDELHKLRCKNRQITTYMSLVGVWSIVLSSMTRDRQSKFCVGTPMANRTVVEAEKLVGLFVNTVVLAMEVKQTQSYAEVMEGVRETCVEALEWSELPFDKLVEELNPERDVSRSPLFQVMFVLNNRKTQSLSDLLQYQPMESLASSVSSKFEITLTIAIEELSNGTVELHEYIEYNKDLFSDNRIEEMARRYHALIRNICSSSSSTQATMKELMDTIEQNTQDESIEEEEHTRNIEWNDTSTILR